MGTTPTRPYMNDTRAKVLIGFYDHTRRAITHYADLEWKIPSLVLALLSAAILLAIKLIDLFGIAAKTIFSIIVGVLMVIAISFVDHCQRKLRDHRRRRQWLEAILGLYEPGEFVSLNDRQRKDLPEYLRQNGDWVLPPEKKTEKISYWSDFWRYPFPGIAMILLVGVLVEWLVWH